jgi:hypothetical protein
MPDIRKILAKCNIKRFGYVHENLLEADIKNGCGILKITVDPETARNLQIASLNGKLKEGVLLLVVDAQEFNKAFEELKESEGEEG